MIKNTSTNILLDPLKGFAAPAIAAMLLLWSAPTAQAGLNGAFLQGTTLDDGTTNLKITSYKAVKWSSASLDPGVFEHPTGNPTRLKVKANGDYFIALTAPITSNSNGNQRSVQSYVVFKNGTAIPEGSSRSTYIRHADGHSESTAHVHILLPGLSANDYIEVKTKRSTTNNVFDTFMQTTSLYAEKIATSRVAFSGTATRKVSGTNLNSGASGLQWTSGRKDSGFTHSANGHEITLTGAGKYLVFANIPIFGGVARGSIALEVKLNGIRISGGLAQQGYIRNAEGSKDGSVHWAGLVTATAGQKLTIDALQKAAGGTITVNSGEKASIFIEKLANTSDLYSATATGVGNGSSNWNPNSKETINWSTHETIDAGTYTHSPSSNAHQVTIKKFGDYLLLYNDALKDGNARGAPRVTVQVNGVDVPGAESKTHYNRRSSGHDESSASLVTLLPALAVNDVVTLSVEREARDGNTNDEVPAKLTLLLRPPLPNPAPTIQVTGNARTVPLTLSTTFKVGGTPTAVTGFAANDITVTNGTLSNFAGSGHTYTFKVTPTTDPATVTLAIANAAATGNGHGSLPLSHVIDFSQPITRPDDLTLWYQFDETTGATASDDSGGGHTGTLINMANDDWVPGKFGNALDFDGSNDSLQPPFAAHPFGTEVTIAFWAYGGTKLPNNNSVMESGNGNRALNIHFPWSNRNIYWDAGSNNSTDRVNQYASDAQYKGSWHHYAFTKNTSTGVQSIYYDGSQWASQSGKTRALATGGISYFRIGSYRNGGGHWHGKLDDWRMYDKVLSLSEIYAIAAGDVGAPSINGPLGTGLNAGLAVSISGFSAAVPVSAYPATWSATGLPSGLDINSTTGVLSGTPTGTGTVNATITATNSYGSANHTLALTFYAPPSAVTAAAASDLSLYGAKLNGSFADTSGTTCTATVYVDTSDKGTSNPSAWAHSFSLDTVTPGAISRVVSGLNIDTTYRYRFTVSNAGGGLVWSGTAGTFKTESGLSPPTLGNVTATEGPLAATVNGTISSTGGENPTVYLLWGDEDRGTDYADLNSWDNVVNLGLLGTGSFSSSLTDLQQGKVYFARVAATNVAGELVSQGVSVFTPDPPYPPVGGTGQPGIKEHIWDDVTGDDKLIPIDSANGYFTPR